MGIYMALISFFVLFCDFVEGGHGPFEGIGFLPHFLDLLRVVFFENGFSELSGAYVFVCC